MFYRQAWLDVNLDNLDYNIKTIKNRLNDKSLFAVIKANGYGVGDFQLAKCAIANDATYLAVSSLDEALSLRFKKIDAPILVLNYVSAQHLRAALQNNVTITVTSFDHAKRIAGSRINGLKLHLKVDTGMNRIGFKDVSEVTEAIQLLYPNHDIEGIYTHYFNSDNLDKTNTQKQYESFKLILDTLKHKFKYIHAANSDAIFNFDENLCNAARSGIAMLGISDFNSELKPVCSLYTKIDHIKKVKKGESISYGATYTCDEDEWIATLPIGYADGLNRHNQNRNVYVAGETALIVGSICMDQCMIKLKKHHPVDTIVEIFGEHILIKDVAKYLNTIPYEILTSISDRMARVYRRKYQIEEILNIRLDNSQN